MCMCMFCNFLCTLREKNRHFSLFDEKFDAKDEFIGNCLPQICLHIFDSIHIKNQPTIKKATLFWYKHFISGICRKGEKKYYWTTRPILSFFKAYVNFIRFSFYISNIGSNVRHKHDLVSSDGTKISLLFAPIIMRKRMIDLAIDFCLLRFRLNDEKNRV